MCQNVCKSLVMDKKIDFLNSVVSLLPSHFSFEVSHFIACEFALESNFGTSPMSCCTNNFCGMLVPAVRLTVCLNPNEKGAFAKYSSFTACVFDYLLWLSSMKFTRKEFDDVQLFVSHLKITGYCPEPDYINRINSIYRQFYHSSVIPISN